MSNNTMYTDKVYTGLDHAPSAFDLRGRILGPNGNNLEYIKSETGAVICLRGGSGAGDPVHIVLQHTRSDKMADARSLTLNLVETVKNELQQWSIQTGTPIPNTPIALPSATATANAPETVNIAPAPVPNMAGSMANQQVLVRPQAVLQFMPQQQYILNQDGSQLIPLIQQSVPMPGQGNFTQLIGSFPQGSVGATQFVDGNLQPVSVGQFRLSSMQNSVPFLQNGIALSQVSLAGNDNTTVSYTSLLPVSSTVSSSSVGLTAAQSAQKLQSEKGQYQMQGDQIQLAPSQTMYIPYQQIQDFGQNGASMQPQIVSISGGGVNSWPTGTSMGLQQITQLPPGTSLNPNVLQLNQKTGQVVAQPMQISASQGTTLTPVANNNQWVRPPIAASLPPGAELIPLNTPAKAANGQEPRGQKRMSDGTSPSSVQLRPIAPAGSQSGVQEKSSSSQTRWFVNAARDSNTPVGNSSSKVVSRTSSASTNTNSSQTSATSMTITQKDAASARSGEKSTQSQDSSKSSEASKIQPLSNIQMYTVSNGMQGFQNVNPATQPNGQLNQMYIVPSSQGLQALSQGTVMGQTLQVGQGNVPIIQPNQLSLPQGVQYNTVPLMQIPQQMQYITPGINLNNPSAQQLGIMPGQQILNPTMIANVPQNASQLTQLNSPAMQSLQGQVITGAQNPQSIQYSTPDLQNIPQTQYVNQQEVMTAQGSYPSQFATHQGNIILPSNYTPVGQQMSTQTPMNPVVSAATTPNTSQPSAYPAGNTTTNVNQQSYPAGVAQPYPPAASMPQLNPQYPSSGSPSISQVSIPDPPPQGTFPVAPSQGQEVYPQSNTPNGSYANGSTQVGYNGNQYGGNGNRAWVGQRFAGPNNGVTQYSVPARGTPPNVPPANIAQTANNSNYWQYT